MSSERDWLCLCVGGGGGGVIPKVKRACQSDSICVRLCSSSPYSLLRITKHPQSRKARPTPTLPCISAPSSRSLTVSRDAFANLPGHSDVSQSLLATCHGLFYPEAWGRALRVMQRPRKISNYSMLLLVFLVQQL